MRFGSWGGSALLMLVAAFTLVAGGCGQDNTGGKAENKTDKAAKAQEKEENKDKPVAQHNFKGRDWCAEHGVPESICAQCNDALVAKFKEKGDWCEKHDRPESQCFICHPELKAKFAAEYKAKYGEDPPAMEDEGAKKAAPKKQ